MHLDSLMHALTEALAPTDPPKKPPHQERVELFMNMAKQTVRDVPGAPTDAELKLRAELILEEVLETFEAMGITVTAPAAGRLDEDEVVLKPKQFTVYRNNSPVDVVKVADGLADCSVVLYGTASTFGISMNPLLEMVDINNLEKFGPGATYSPTGKLIKPPGHKPPDIERCLVEQGWSPPNKEGNNP